MRTDFPTVEIYFLFAFTYCKLKVYKEEAGFALKVLTVLNVEFLTEKENERWQEIDTRVLLNMVREALPEIISKSTAKAISEIF